MTELAVGQEQVRLELEGGGDDASISPSLYAYCHACECGGGCFGAGAGAGAGGRATIRFVLLLYADGAGLDVAALLLLVDAGAAVVELLPNLGDEASPIEANISSSSFSIFFLSTFLFADGALGLDKLLI
mmetsp:Transcript_3407/g.7400  ORF Transcript_3407/g.7400 Transcript_3407/m.7400 type:complete len:130 (-) Transcript_3407:483-872(-)